MSNRPVTAVVLLAAIAATCVGLVALVENLTRERAAASEQQLFESRLRSTLPGTRGEWLLSPVNAQGSDLAVWRASNDDRVHYVLRFAASEGYGGEIVLLANVDDRGVVGAVRVVRHHETPGLGDAIERDRGDWVVALAGLSLASPEPAWRLRRDGGEIDQITGATITSRAVANALHNALINWCAREEPGTCTTQ